MDYVKRKYSREFIGTCSVFTDAQVNGALSYIDVHRAEMEVEYQIVLQEAEELRRYYKERNRELLARIAAKPPKRCAGGAAMPNLHRREIQSMNLLNIKL